MTVVHRSHRFGIQAMMILVCADCKSFGTVTASPSSLGGGPITSAVGKPEALLHECPKCLTVAGAANRDHPAIRLKRTSLAPAHAEPAKGAKGRDAPPWPHGMRGSRAQEQQIPSSRHLAGLLHRYPAVPFFGVSTLSADAGYRWRC